MPVVSLPEVLGSSCSRWPFYQRFTGFKSHDGKVILTRLGPSRVELVYSKMVLKIAILWPPQSLVHYYIYTMI